MRLDQINKFFHDYFHQKPFEINQGNCYHWAMIAHTLYGGELYRNTKHAIIKIGDKFYDSESINGVDDWVDIPVFKRKLQKGIGIDSIIKCQEYDFIKYWDSYGKNFWSQQLVNNGVKYVKNKTYSLADRCTSYIHLLLEVGRLGQVREWF